MNLGLKYVAVDDDEFNNMLCSMIIEDTLGETDITTFTKPEEGLAFIKNVKDPTVLFLDINMPTLSGWEFLEQYEKLGTEVKKNLSIYMLSSSLDQRDKNKAHANKNVKGFISKPLDKSIVTSIANGEFKE